MGKLTEDRKSRLGLKGSGVPRWGGGCHFVLGGQVGLAAKVTAEERHEEGEGLSHVAALGKSGPGGGNNKREARGRRVLVCHGHSRRPVWLECWGDQEVEGPGRREADHTGVVRLTEGLQDLTFH